MEISDTLHKMAVVIEGNNTKLKQAARDAMQTTRKMTDTINAELKKIQSPMEQLKKNSGGTDNTSKKTQEIMAGIRNYVKEAQIAAGLKVYTDDYLRLGRDISSTEKELEKLRQKMAGMDENKRFVSTEEFKDLEKNIEKNQSALDKLLASKQKMEASGKALVETDDYREISSHLADAQGRMDRLTAKKNEWMNLGFGDKGNAMPNLTKSIQETEKEILYLKGELKELENSGQAFRQTDAYRDLTGEIKRTEKSLKEYRDLRSQMLLDGSNLKEAEEFQKTNLAIADAENKLRSYYATKQRMEASGQDVRFNSPLSSSSAGATAEAVAKQGMAGATARIREMNAALMEAIRRIPVIGRVASEAAYLGSKAFSGLRSVFSKVTAGIKTSGGAFASLIQKFRSGIPHIGKARSSMKGMGDTGRGLGGILRTVAMSAKFMFASFIIRGGLNAAKEGMQNLAQYSDRTNASLSLLLSGLTQVKNSLATAFAPVLNAIAPILDTLISYLVAATNAIAQFFAALTGQGTYVRAVKVQQDYAASLGGTAAAANGANAAAKELQKTIMGFDEINKLDDNTGSSGGSGGGAGSGGLSPSDMFTTETVQNTYANFVEKIKEAWESADFTEIGGIFGGKIRDALDSISWDEIQATAKKIGKSIATFINGALETSGLADSIGKTAAGAINTGISGVDSFLTNLHWDSAGQFVADALNGFISGANWAGAGTAVKKGLNGIFTAANTWADAFDFKQAGTAVKTAVKSALTGISWTKANTGASKIGSGIATALNSAMTKDVFEAVGQTIAGALNTVVSGAYSFIGTIDFDGWGTSIASGINRFFGTFDWKKAGLTFTTAVMGILNTLKTALEKADWETIGSDIGTFVSNIDFKSHLLVVGGIIWEAIKGAFKATLTAVKENPDLVVDLSGLLLFVFTTKTIFNTAATAIIGGIASAVSGASAIMVNPITLAIVGMLGLALLNVKAEEITHRNECIMGFLKDLIDDWGTSIEKWAQSDEVQAFINTTNTVLKGIFKKIGIDLDEPRHPDKLVNDQETPEGEVYEYEIDITANDKTQEGVKSAKENITTVPDKKSTKAVVLNEALVGISDVTFSLNKIPDKKETKITANAASAQKTVTEYENSILSSPPLAIGVAAKILTSSQTLMGFVNAGWDKLKNKSVGVGTYLQKDTMTSLRNKMWDAWGGIKNRTVGVGTHLQGGSSKNLRDKVWAGWKSLNNRTVGVDAIISTSASTLWSGMSNEWIKRTAGLVLTANAVINIADVVWQGTKEIFAGKKAEGGIYSNGKWRPVTAAANGGSFSTGQMFIAREAGPELVGSIGRSTAVMNNNQIVSSVSAGVYQAMAAAMSQSSSGNKGGATPIFNVYVGGTRVTDVVIEEVNRRTSATGVCPIKT